MKFIISVVFVICLFVVPAHALDSDCSEYINLEKINALHILNNYATTLTGSGTMPQTGSGTMSPCTGSGSISGSIFTQFHEPIQSVHVELQSSQDNYPLYTNTDIDGDYAFSPIENEFNYLITPTKEGDDLNGISTLDVLLLANLVFRPGQNVSPYTLIAADVNQDQHLNLRDAVELLYLIIGKRDALAQSWVFVDASQEFIDEANPWPYHDEITVNALDGSSPDNDFIGIKVGDLTGNANPWITEEVESRSHVGAHMLTEDIYLKKGDIQTIHFYSDELEDIKGMQVFLDLDGIEVLGIQSGILDAEKAAFHQSDQTVFMSWFGATDTESKVLFSMLVKAHKAGLLSDRFKEYEHWLPTEAYVGDALEIRQLDLEFSSHTYQQTFTVEQNYPNPFISKTEITCNVGERGSISLDIFDDTGRLVHQKHRAGVIGKNTFNVNRDELNESGIYYYSVTFKGHVKTNSLLLLD